MIAKELGTHATLEEAKQAVEAHMATKKTVLTYRSTDGVHADTIRCDTGEQIRTRKLTTDEKRLQLA